MVSLLFLVKELFTGKKYITHKRLSKTNKLSQKFSESKNIYYIT